MAFLTDEQWRALSAFVKSEAAYAANEVVNRNDLRDAINRREAEDDCEIALKGA